MARFVSSSSWARPSAKFLFFFSANKKQCFFKRVKTTKKCVYHDIKILYFLYILRNKRWSISWLGGSSSFFSLLSIHNKRNGEEAEKKTKRNHKNSGMGCLAEESLPFTMWCNPEGNTELRGFCNIRDCRVGWSDVSQSKNRKCWASIDEWAALEELNW